MNFPHSTHLLRGNDLLPLIDVRTRQKVLLHEHLDGGLRPSTVIELAHSHGYRELPTTNAADLAVWFHRLGHATRLRDGIENTSPMAH